MARLITRNGLEANAASAIAYKGELLIAMDSMKIYVGTNNNGGSGSTEKIEITDVLSYENIAAFPTTGIPGKLYIARSEKRTFFWDGVNYSDLTASTANIILDTAVAGDTTHTYSADKILTLLSSLTTSNFAANVIDTDTTLAANSDSRIATQKAAKTYIDNHIGGVVGGLNYKGAFDASLLGTQLDNAKKGDFYKVSVEGTILTTISLKVGDMIIINKDVTGTPVSADIDVIDNTESADLLKTSDISTNADFTIDPSKLTTRQAIETFVNSKISILDGGTF